jgi:hypothetical protein
MSVSKPSAPVSNPEKDHRRQAFWQIYLPLSLGAAVFLALCVWTVLFTIGYVPEAGLADQQSPAAKVAVIWMLIAPCFGGLIQLALLGGSVYLLARGIKGLPSLAHRAQEGIARLSAAIHHFADLAAKPVINVASAKAGWDRFLDKLAFWKHSAEGE